MRNFTTQDWLTLMIVGVVIIWTIVVKYIGPVISTWITTIYMFITMVLALVAPASNDEKD